MADYSIIKSLIEQVVKTNGEQEITGANLQNVLVSMINAVASSNNEDFDRINGNILNLLNYVDAENEDIRNEMQELANRLDTNRFGYNVSVFGLVAGVHTLATAVKNVPPAERFGGQKITFKTDAGWVTYQNTSLSIDNYEDVDNWVLDSGVNVEGDVTITNNPDYEDLTQNNQNELKFADKEYNAATFSGLGRVYLRKNIVSNKNVLTQAMLADASTIYIIQYDYDLNGESITVPNGSILYYQGGSLNNGTLNGNNCELAGDVKIPLDLDSDGNFANKVWNIEQFGAVGNPTREENISCVANLQHCIDFVPVRSIIEIPANNYYIDETINVNKTVTMIGNGNSNYYGCHFYNFDTSEPFVFFNVSEHFCTFENLMIRASKNENDFNNYIHTCFDVGGENVPIDLTTFKEVQMFAFNTGIHLTANNTIIKNTGFIMCNFSIVLDKYLPNSSYQRNVTISECRFHSSVVGVKFNEPWSAVTINNCDVNNVSCLAYNPNGNSNVISNNAIFNPISRTVNVVTYNYIVYNSQARLTVSGNNVHIASSTEIGFFTGTGMLTGNTIQNCKLPTILGDYCICSGNNFYQCGSNDDANAAIVVEKATSVIIGNVLQANSTSNYKVAIKLKDVSPVCRDNNIFGYITPLKGVNAADTANNNIILKAIELYNNKGFDDRQYQPSLDNTLNGCEAYNANWERIHWKDSKWLLYDGAQTGVSRVGNNNGLPTGDKIYRGFQYYNIEYNKAFYASSIDSSNNVTWVDAQGYSGAKNAGTTEQRPTFGTGTNLGYQYFDTTLQKPIYWAGGVWKDATGTQV